VGIGICQILGIHDPAAAHIDQVEQAAMVLFQQLSNGRLQGHAEQQGAALQAVFPADQDEVGLVVEQRGQSGDERGNEQGGVAATEKCEFGLALEGEQALIQRRQGPLVLDGVFGPACRWREEWENLLGGGHHDDRGGDRGKLSGKPGEKRLAPPSQTRFRGPHAEAGPAAGDEGCQSVAAGVG